MKNGFPIIVYKDPMALAKYTVGEYPYHGGFGTDSLFKAIKWWIQGLIKFLKVQKAMRYLDKKIALTTKHGSWKGVDVDAFMDEIRGREPEDES